MIDYKSQPTMNRETDTGLEDGDIGRLLTADLKYAKASEEISVIAKERDALAAKVIGMLESSQLPKDECMIIGGYVAWLKPREYSDRSRLEVRPWRMPVPNPDR